MHYFKSAQPVERIIEIVKQLYAFEHLYVKDLAEKYEVSAKTITRHMEKIQKIIPLHRKRGVWWLDSSRMVEHTRLPSAMLHAFASNAGLSIDCLDDSSESIPMISFAIAYDGIPVPIAEKIIESIERKCRCRFSYTNNRGVSSVKSVSPIKLYTSKGKWYLIAKDSASLQIRSYDFLKIKDFALQTDMRSNLDEADIHEAQSRAGIWSSADTQPYEVQLHVSAYARRYAEEVPLHKSQSLLSPHSDGSATYIYEITHDMELMPSIKEWIPHIHVESPERLRQILAEDIRRYLEEMDI